MLTDLLRERFDDAVPAALGEEFAGTDPVLRRSTHADFQADLAMGLAKRAGMKPREIAEKLLAALQIDDIARDVSIAGPGFINITLRPETVTRAAAHAGHIEPAETRERVVVDYSGPNIAKEMHVGHLRSTIIGDAVVRVLEARGHEVIRDNHIGDWGRPFGMLIEHVLDIGETEAAHELSIGDWDLFYKQANEKFKADETFADRARRRVVALQTGDEETLRLWKLLVTESERYFDSVYERLDVRLTPGDIKGESFYNHMLDAAAGELESRGIARVDDGALCAFPDGYTGREGKPLPLIVRYSHGAYGYEATDLAGLKYRVETLHANRLIYLMDAGQQQRTEMAFAVARMADWVPPDVRTEMVPFGQVLGTDGRRYRTREGLAPKLSDLLDEAVNRAARVVAEKNPDLLAEEQAAVARAVGIGAVKYADLSSDRIKDYVFDFDRMLALQGNTAPYLQYAHARIHSILRKADVPPGSVEVTHDAERALLLELDGFEATVAAVEETLQPHKLCTYLYAVATAFSSFYEQCQVIGSDHTASRLGLCLATADVLSKGLNLLGIAAPKRM